MAAKKSWTQKRKELQQVQRQREANAVRRAVIVPDNESTNDGTVENVIKADSEFTLPGRIIVEWDSDCKIGRRYENGAFVVPPEKQQQTT